MERHFAQTLHDSGFKGVWMLDPGIKHEEKEGYEAYDTGCEKDVWVQTVDGKPYVDFTQSKVRTWWVELVKEFVGNDIDGIWNDMNEPAVFKGLSGQPFAGPNIGGFAGNATPKLFARWMGIGSMMPFSRGHFEKATSDQEPWSFGPEVEEICHKALYRQYRLLPHFYTLFHRAHNTGLPIMAPLFYVNTYE
ncbi:unnamed protein product [Sphagnum jensenii]|uniref:Glycoside hydrolase family 31 TIM barrel domain-containing protein n=1 Tax=Sphagnum jensenii TaxID=128206 RepID=A0ABP0WYJ7_9BRYO